jgi:hypothetical protein
MNSTSRRDRIDRPLPYPFHRSSNPRKQDVFSPFETGQEDSPWTPLRRMTLSCVRLPSCYLKNDPEKLPELPKAADSGPFTVVTDVMEWR